MRENGKTDSKMEKVKRHGLMGQYTLDISKMGIKKVGDYTSGQMEPNTMENGSMEKLREMGSSGLRMGPNIKDNGLKGKGMEKGNLHLKRVNCMLVNL